MPTTVTRRTSYRRPRTQRRTRKPRVGKSWFGTSRARPEMKRKHTSVEDQSITGAAAYQQVFAFDGIGQGLNDSSRIGSRITGKYINSKFMFDNQSDNKAMLVRYCIWTPKSTTQTLALTGTNFINNKLFKVYKTGYVAVNHDSAKILSINIPLKNRVFDFSGDDTTFPISEDRMYLTMCCVISGQAVKFTHNTVVYYVDN